MALFQKQQLHFLEIVRARHRKIRILSGAQQDKIFIKQGFFMQGAFRERQRQNRSIEFGFEQIANKAGCLGFSRAQLKAREAAAQSFDNVG